MADLLAHRAGLAWVDGTMSFEEMLRWEPVVEALERQAPSWPPGTAHGYHATTYGWLVGEVVRRVTGMSVGTYLRTEIAGAARGGVLHRPPAPPDEPRVARLVSFIEGLKSGATVARHPERGFGRRRARTWPSWRSWPRRTSPRTGRCSRRCPPRAVRSPTKRSGTAPALHAGRDPRRQRHLRRPVAGSSLRGLRGRRDDAVGVDRFAS